MPEGNYYNQTPSNNVIVCGLPKHITEADVSHEFIIWTLGIKIVYFFQIAVDLKQFGLQPASIRLIRKKRTGK